MEEGVSPQWSDYSVSNETGTHHGKCQQRIIRRHLPLRARVCMRGQKRLEGNRKCLVTQIKQLNTLKKPHSVQHVVMSKKKISVNESPVLMECVTSRSVCPVMSPSASSEKSFTSPHLSLQALYLDQITLLIWISAIIELQREITG